MNCCQSTAAIPARRQPVRCHRERGRRVVAAAASRRAPAKSAAVRNRSTGSFSSAFGHSPRRAWHVFRTVVSGGTGSSACRAGTAAPRPGERRRPVEHLVEHPTGHKSLRPSTRSPACSGRVAGVSMAAPSPSGAGSRIDCLGDAEIRQHGLAPVEHDVLGFTSRWMMPRPWA